MARFLYVELVEGQYLMSDQCVIDVDSIVYMKQYEDVVTLYLGGEKMIIKGTIANLLLMIEDLK